ncbi:DUF805 domain-containing protein [Halocynthiibacter sp. C4]|uniref:DUF805 domain-containing protein n=1 Tax=Halocynthiibacter sp. C4 TaxID=2992758 RepID=UPI00237C442F|nr:DUF805 domain-containing protein [Halocynthiibacter sp. C4]MDE0589910.1 DUF805 domain-containing protein [Halocynthiibacter sp. C4]
MSDISKATRTVLSKYATFTGRATRPEFWWWALAVFGINIVAQIIDGVLVAPMLGFTAFQAEAGQPISILVMLALFLPNIAVAARRLHDIGRSGWWLLIAFIPLIGVLVLIYFYVQPSDQGSNEYGAPEPLT